MDVEYGLRTEGNLPVDISKTGLPDVNITPPTKRASQFESSFVKKLLGRLPLLGLTVLGLIYDSPPAFSQKVNNNSSSSAENTLVMTPPTLETNKEPLNLTATEVFGNNVTTETELRKTPDDILDYQLITNEQGKVTEIVVLSYKDNGVDAAVTRMVFNPATGKIDKGFQTSKEPLAIDPYAIYKSGERILVGGRSSGTISILESKDNGRTFNAKKLSFSDDQIRKISPIPETNKLFVTTWNLLSIYDPDQDTMIPTVTGKRERVSISSIPANSRTVTLYSELDNKLSKDVINIDTGQVLSSEIVSQGTRVDAYALIQDNSGVIGEITNNHIDNILTINLKGSKRTLEYKSWLNHLNIPNSLKDSLFFTSISVLNDRIWAAGGYPSILDGYPRATVASWPLNSDPNTNKDVLTVYRIGDADFSIAKRMEWGIFGLGLPGFLVRVENMGLVFIETKADGSPADNKTVTYLAIKDQATPLYRVNLPLTMSRVSP